MIPAFLRSLAALVRQLITNGKAVHVTEQTAKELELLAGLPWLQGCECEPDAEPEEPGEKKTHYLRTCANCSRQWEGLHCPHDGYQNCCPLCEVRPAPLPSLGPADLALGWLLASRAQMRNQDAADGSWYRVADEDDTQRAAARAELAVIAVTAPGPWYLLSDPASMHTMGTREGARATWRFVVEQFVRHDDERADKDKEWNWQLALIGERYHRELEAMK